MTYASLTLAANLIVVVGTITGLLLYLGKWRANRAENKHLLVVKMLKYKTNAYRALVDQGCCTYEDKWSLELLVSIYNDPDKSMILQRSYIGHYEYMHNLVALGQEVKSPSFRIVSFKDKFQ